MKTYRSKIDWWLIILIVGIFVYPIIDGILSKEYLLSIVCGIILGLIFLLFTKIKYKIDGDKLIVWYIKIDIHSVRKIYKTHNPLSSPALSLDRIAIVYNKFDEILISPKNKKEFIEELLKINPNIVVEN